MQVQVRHMQTHSHTPTHIHADPSPSTLPHWSCRLSRLPWQHLLVTTMMRSEVRGAEFDADWQRQPWHNLYQSTRLPLDPPTSVCEEIKRDCVQPGPPSVRPGHPTAKGLKLTKLGEVFWHISLYLSSFVFLTWCRVTVYVGKSDTKKIEILFDKALCQSFSETLSPLGIYTSCLCQKKIKKSLTLTKYCDSWQWYLHMN